MGRDSDGRPTTGHPTKKERNETMNNIKIKATTPCYENGITLTPYVTEDGEIWLASEGNGCGDDIMLEDTNGLTAEEINAKWSDIDLDALRAGADEIAAADEDAAEYIRMWADNCDRARAAAGNDAE